MIFVLSSCIQTKDSKELDIQGHRGARGLAPENTIPAFIAALDLGVSTLELDLVVSKDLQLVASHEPYFSPKICSYNNGAQIPKDTIINLYQLNYEEISQFDCGLKQNIDFPEQHSVAAVKPLLIEVIDTVEYYVKINNLRPVKYNIELKTQVKTDNLFHPEPNEFAELVYQCLSQKNILDRVIIQSFDFRTLIYFHQHYQDIPLALLIENDNSWETNIDSLGFKPSIYSCQYKLLSQRIVQELQTEGFKVIPWTVNENADIERLISWNVDGIISDYPDRVLKMMNTNE